MPTATSPKIIAVVVVSIAMLALVGVCTLSWCIIMEKQPDPVLLTAYVGITTGIVGTLSGMLISTKSNSTTAEPVATTVTNTPQNPVNVSEQPASPPLIEGNDKG